MDWKMWYQKARVKSNYKDQAEELIRLIDLHVGMNRVQKVLDVGCGDARLEPYFSHREYWGLDQEYNEFDLLSEEWVDVPKDFDLGVSSLVMMMFGEKEAKYIFDKTMDRCKWVILYEENLLEEERININTSEKYYHNYPKWDKNIVCWGQSKLNENWRWYVFKGRVK